MGEGHKYDTDEFFAVHYQHLDKSWLKSWLEDLNEMVGLLKQRFSGNAHMHLPWSGGIPQDTEWSVKQKKKKRTQI
jgi:hypothetical protein